MSRAASKRSLLRWMFPLLATLCLAAPFVWRQWGWQALNTAIQHEFPAVPRIGTTDLAAWLQDARRPPPILLDVREPAEFAVSHLANARQVEPGTDPATLNLPKDQPIVTYCSVGHRSAKFARQLERAGYTQVRNLEGSIFQWANEGRPVVRDGHPVATVHPCNQFWGRLLQPARRADVQPPDKVR